MQGRSESHELHECQVRLLASASQAIWPTSAAAVAEGEFALATPRKADSILAGKPPSTYGPSECSFFFVRCMLHVMSAMLQQSQWRPTDLWPPGVYLLAVSARSCVPKVAPRRDLCGERKTNRRRSFSSRWINCTNKLPGLNASGQSPGLPEMPQNPRQ